MVLKIDQDYGTKYSSRPRILLDEFQIQVKSGLGEL